MELNPSWNLFGLKASMLTLALGAFSFSQQPSVKATIQGQFWMKCQRHAVSIKNANCLFTECGDGFAFDALCIKPWRSNKHAWKALSIQCSSIGGNRQRAVVEPVCLVAVYADSVTKRCCDVYLDGSLKGLTLTTPRISGN
jgi:hypothetical protein